jgi:hypothetical protein
MVKALEVPSEVLEMDDADEVARVWIGAGDSIVSLHDLFGEDIGNWGMLLADMAVHVARMKLHHDSVPEIQTLKAIEEGYRGRMASFHDLDYRSLTANN